MDEQASLCSASGFSMLYRREKDFAMKDQNRIEEQASFTENVYEPLFTLFTTAVSGRGFVAD